jgi:DNA-binding transcriptional ArsR family regulator
MTDFEKRARVLKALAHPSRLLMIDELSRGERCVSISRVSSVRTCPRSPSTSRCSKGSGIVADERTGTAGLL